MPCYSITMSRTMLKESPNAALEKTLLGRYLNLPQPEDRSMVLVKMYEARPGQSILYQNIPQVGNQLTALTKVTLLNGIVELKIKSLPKAEYSFLIFTLVLLEYFYKLSFLSIIRITRQV